jgi:hypothetical protein
MNKKYLAVVELSQDFEGVEDLEPVLRNAYGIQGEIESWLSDLGFNVRVRVAEDKEGLL